MRHDQAEEKICESACFNSRTLGRVRRLLLSVCYAWTMLFQFTHPGKGATSVLLGYAPRYAVSIHAPWEGCDHYNIDDFNTDLMFQFTHPGKGATRPSLRECIRLYIVSIHAPWEGCDQELSIFSLQTIKFQFTHPGKGATRL